MTRQPITMSEAAITKADRFVRVAGRRTNKALRALRLLKKCANRASYVYADEQALKLLLALEEELTSVRRAFEPDRELRFSFEKETNQ